MSITIEPIESRHGACIQKVISDPEIARTSEIPDALPPEGAGAWIERMKVRREQGRALTFAILTDNCVVGVCQLGSRDRTISDSAELGFFVGKSFWGRGYATKASRLVLAHAFRELGLTSVSAACLAWNTGAVRVLEKLGFEFTHTGPPPRGSKFPKTEQFQYWILTSEGWAAASKLTSEAIQNGKPA